MVEAVFTLGLPNPTAHVFPCEFGCDSVPTHAHLGAGLQPPNTHLVMLQLSLGYKFGEVELASD